MEHDNKALDEILGLLAGYGRTAFLQPSQNVEI